MFSPFLRSNALRMAARGVAASFSAGYCAFGDEQGAPGVAGEAYPTYSRADIKARNPRDSALYEVAQAIVADRAAMLARAPPAS